MAVCVRVQEHRTFFGGDPHLQHLHFGAFSASTCLLNLEKFKVCNILGTLFYFTRGTTGFGRGIFFVCFFGDFTFFTYLPKLLLEENEIN